MVNGSDNQLFGSAQRCEPCFIASDRCFNRSLVLKNEPNAAPEWQAGSLGGAAQSWWWPVHSRGLLGYPKGNTEAIFATLLVCYFFDPDYQSLCDLPEADVHNMEYLIHLQIRQAKQEYQKKLPLA